MLPFTIQDDEDGQGSRISAKRRPSKATPKNADAAVNQMPRRWSTQFAVRLVEEM